MSRKVSYKVFLFFSLVVILLPSVVLSLDEYIDPFSFHTVGLAQIYCVEARYFPYPITGSLGWQSTANEISIRFVPILFLLVLSQITGISFWHLLFLPIIGFILPLIAYLICKNLQQSTVTAIFYAIIVSYSFIMFNMFYIPAGMFFFLVFLLIFLKSLRFGQAVKGVNTSLLLLTLFIITYYTYYTTEFLILGYLLGMLFFAWFLERFNIKFNVKILNVRFYSLLVSFIVIFTGFDRVIYSFLESVNIEKGLSLFGSYVNYVLRFLSVGEEAVFEYRPHIGNPLIVYIDLVQQVIIWASIVVYLLLYSIRIKVNKKGLAILTFEGLVLLAFFSAGVLETLIYLLVGYGVYTRTISLFSSLAALYSLNKLYTTLLKRKKRIIGIVLIITMLLIVSTSVAKFVIRASDPLNPNGARLHSKMNATISWTTLYTTDRTVIADLRTIGQVFFEIAKEGKIGSIGLRRMGPEINYLYSFNDGVIDKVFKKRNTLLVLSHEFKERAIIAGEAWRFSPPIKEAFSLLDHCASISRIFDDGRGLLYDYS